MFDQMEKEAREELIKLYEDYIENPENPDLEERGLSCDHKYSGAVVLSKEVSYAGFRATHIAFKELSIEEAKKILETLK